MKNSLKTGLGFGLTSGVITTLGLIIGLYSGTHSKIAVLGGILTIAIADAFSDALGIHISEESETSRPTAEIWESTFSTFLSKLIFAASFILPILFLPFKTAIIINVIWGLSLLATFSFHLAKQRGEKPWKTITEHTAIGLTVILITHLLGNFISSVFG
jgi:VIT1/CCC1 family predicted Fe2+/Mn2+ transporter